MIKKLFFRRLKGFERRLNPFELVYLEKIKFSFVKSKIARRHCEQSEAIRSKHCFFHL
jgi:hypothetical protein